jgi:hypothetical protein
MSGLITTASRDDSNKLDVIVLALERIEQDLHKAKCEIKTAIRDVSLHQNGIYDLLLRLRVDFNDIDSRLHGIELDQQRQNSST